jgi:alkylation response protein AidB-like acyl-CoA dehydrogenase
MNIKGASVAALPAETSLTEDQTERLARAKEFLARRAREVDSAGKFPTENWGFLHELGILGLCVPKADGGWGAGPGGDMRRFVEAIACLASGCSSTAQGVAVHAHCCTMIHLLGTAEQRQRFLHGMTTQKAIYAFLGSEPTQRIRPDGTRAGYDTTAVRTETGWRVNGKKFFATNSTGATWIGFLAVATEDGLEQIVLPMMAADTPGLAVIDSWDNMGQRATASGAVEVHDVEIPDDQMIGPPGAIYRYGLLLHSTWQLSFVAELLGIAEAALEFAKDWLQTKAKPPPGLPSLSHEPHVQRLMGELEVAVSAARSLMLDAAGALQRGQLAPASLPDAFDAVIRAKVLTTEVVIKVTNDIFQICSARATTREYGADLYWRNARTLTLHDVLDRQKSTVGRRALGIEDPPSVFQAPRPA